MSDVKPVATLPSKYRGIINTVTGNFQRRKVERFESPTCIISTVLITDAEHQFETSISHKAFNQGKWIVVEEYDTLDLAKEGHGKWVETMGKDPLPGSLLHVSTAKAEKEKIEAATKEGTIIQTEFHRFPF